MLTITDLSLNFSGEPLFKDVNLKFTEGNCYGVIGANGAGKSTFLRILSGDLDPSTGTVSIAPKTRMSVLKQDHFAFNEETVLNTVLGGNPRLLEVMQEKDALYMKDPFTEEDGNRAAELEAEFAEMGGWDAETEAGQLLNGLGLDADAIAYTEMQYLGDVEKVKVLLARALFGKPDILLLDEPTNHLDMQAVDWLGEYLENYRGTVLIISHDRWFIDQCCDRVIEIHDCTCEFYNGNYSYYAVERERRREEQLKHHEHELAEKKRLEATARAMHEHGTEHLAKRAASIEKRIARMKVTDRPKAEKRMTVTFGDPNYETEEVLKVKDITKSYDGREILHDVSFNIRNRERVALLGANGAGKTTLLKILLGEETPDNGTVRKGVGLKPAYLPQQVHFSNPHRNLIDTLIYDKNVSMQVARNRLGSFQFTGETQMKTVEMLSGGEKSRLRLCELMYDPLNFLILDEPTNHLDLASREWIEEAVEAFDGTLLFVSHDRYFVERFATRVLYLEDGKLIDFIGSYSDFLAYREKGIQPENPVPVPAPKRKKPDVPTLDDVPRPPEKPKRTGGTKNLQKQLNTLEREISQLEQQSADLEQQMVEVSSDSARLLELMTEKEACDESLAAKMDEWEAVAAELEELQQ